VPLSVSRRRGARFIHECVRIILDHPDGTTLSDVVRSFDTTALLPEVRVEDNPAVFVHRVTHFFSLRARPLICAGWLTSRGSRWFVTDAGCEAYATFPDPEELLLAAGRSSFKARAAAWFPRAYELLARVWYQARIERYLIKRIGLAILVRILAAPPARWKTILPLQEPMRIRLEQQGLRTLEELLVYLTQNRMPYAEGGNTIYLCSTSVKSGVFSPLMERYPHDAGLKIIKNVGPVSNTSYVHVTQTSSSLLHKLITHRLPELSLVATFLYNWGLGPRMYDLVEIQFGEQTWSAFVVQHVTGRAPTNDECEEAMTRFRGLEREGLLAVTLPEGYEDDDLVCPDCNGNAITDCEGRFRYIDFQNFLLLNYESYMQRMTAGLGNEAKMTGGRQIGKVSRGRATREGGWSTVERSLTRRRALEEALRTAGASLHDRVVLSVDDDVSATIASYLGAEARWCHGWVDEGRSGWTEGLLLALGCTRFSITDRRYERASDLERDLPEFLRAGLKGCVISGGMSIPTEGLWSLPWSLMVIEGRGEGVSGGVEEHLEEVARLMRVRIGGRGAYATPGGERRQLAVVIRG
jgi:hypothetical protein